MNRHAILSVVAGPDAPRRHLLAPGDVVRVGNGARADLVLERDTSLQKVHFELDWDGERAEIRVHAPPPATRLDGKPTLQAWARHGAWIEAGATQMVVTYEGTASEEVLRRTPRQQERAVEALALLRAEPALFAVLDPARDRRILVLLREAVDPHGSLYEGISAVQLENAAPVLVRFLPDSRLLGQIVEEGWGDAWGVFLRSTRSPKEVRRLLRGLLRAAIEGTKAPMYFRFYDPRVLRAFLPLATPAQRTRLFGDLDAFLYESPEHELRIAERTAAPSAVATGAGKQQAKSAGSAGAEPLRVSRDQYEALGGDVRERFVAQLADYLRAEFSDEVGSMSSEGLLSWVSRSVAWAAAHRVRTQPEVTQLVLLLLAMGPETAPAAPWVLAVLADADLDAGGKVRSLIAQAEQREIVGLDRVVFPELLEDI